MITVMCYTHTHTHTDPNHPCNDNDNVKAMCANLSVPFDWNREEHHFLAIGKIVMS